MAVKSRGQSSVWKFLQFVMRFLGLNGLIAAAIGAVLWLALDYEEVGIIVVIAGGSAVALALLAEVRGLVGAVASHRGAAGLNVFLQVALASALLIGANVYSFSTYQRYDCTYDRIFTLDEKLQEKLAQLRGDTDIIVYLQHVSFGQRVDLRQDEYDQAAEKIIIEKVKDLVEQFKDFSPRFRVHILDTQKRTYKEREDELSKISKDLVAAIKKAPEDSIFFYSHETKQTQRLGFNAIYHLDKRASEEADGKKGNLVLIDQGVQNFADKVFKIEEKKPRVGIAVVHGWLGQEGAEEYGMPALKKMLATQGFIGRDIVLKKNMREPTAMEFEESRYEILTGLRSRLDREIKDYEEKQKVTDKVRTFLDTKTLDEVNTEYALVLTVRGPLIRSAEWVDNFRKKQGREPATIPFTEKLQASAVKDLTKQSKFLEAELASKRKRLVKAEEEQSKLPEEKLAESRRITDVRVRFGRLLSEIDLLVVPRFTVMNLLRDEMINPRAHGMDDTQLEAIKEFMKAGKPVLFCLGPVSGRGEDPGAERDQDSLEKLLERFNVFLPDQTILFDSEGDAMAEIEDREQLQNGGLVEVPPADFTWTPPEGARLSSAIDVKRPPPVRTSLRLTAHGLGENSRAGLKIRYPRPVYVRPCLSPETVVGAFGTLSLPWSAAPLQTLAAVLSQSDREFDEKAVFLMTNAECWNEVRPFITEDWTPHFVVPESDDPDKGTVQRKRRGPFPIGVAFEADVPADWYKDAAAKPARVRLAVIGDGAIFKGDNLSPIREKLFLDVSNWLLGRENQLTRESAHPLSYPRVELDSKEKNLWEWGMRAGLPVLFICLGVNVWLVRRMR